jgi:hypothetical protein
MYFLAKGERLANESESFVSIQFRGSGRHGTYNFRTVSCETYNIMTLPQFAFEINFWLHHISYFLYLTEHSGLLKQLLGVNHFIVCTYDLRTDDVLGETICHQLRLGCRHHCSHLDSYQHVFLKQANFSTTLMLGQLLCLFYCFCYGTWRLNMTVTITELDDLPIRKISFRPVLHSMALQMERQIITLRTCLIHSL